MKKVLSYVITCEIIFAAIGWLLIEKGFLLSPDLHWKLMGAFLGFFIGGFLSTLVIIWQQVPE